MPDLTQKRTYLGMPGYGKQTAAAGKGFWRARRDMSGVWCEYRCGSLLAANFNALWCGALNLCHKGDGVDYFAMLHDDIGPQDFWLDTLIDELEARSLDVLGVAVPIKDRRGLSSIALQRPDGDTWRPLCRLSMTEIHQLPETFTGKDVGGHELLLNTGCWVCRFDPDWARKVRFTINDRIVFDRGRDMFRAEVEPEDWYFSRLCHELGLRIGATRKVQVTHRGDVDFQNAEPFGHHYDPEYLDRSVLPSPHADGWRFPSNVDGWLTAEEGRKLAELARGGRVLEIGSYCGRSTVCLAQTATHVTAVDYFDGRGTPQPRNTLPDFRAALEEFGVADRVSTCHPEAEFGAGYDLGFIDGAHDRESVARDAARATAALKPGGLLVFHDYRTRPGEYDGRWDPGVTEAVDALIASGAAALISRCGSLAIVRPRPKKPTTVLLREGQDPQSAEVARV